jgi:hypothetical protein
MSFLFHDLDERTREYMRDEFEQDVASNRVYLSPRLNNHGTQSYPDLARQAFTDGSEVSLAASLGAPGGPYIKARETATRQGKTYEKAVRHDAAVVLAEGEFNRFYLRGLCRRAIDDDIGHLVIYRAKQVQVPRPESVAMIDTTIDPAKLLDDLRQHVGVDTALGLPPGPSSGLSARLP